VVLFARRKLASISHPRDVATRGPSTDFQSPACRQEVNNDYDQMLGLKILGSKWRRTSRALPHSYRGDRQVEHATLPRLLVRDSEVKTVLMCASSPEPSAPSAVRSGTYANGQCKTYLILGKEGLAITFLRYRGILRSRHVVWSVGGTGIWVGKRRL
jgi:hypothetical protein